MLGIWIPSPSLSLATTCSSESRQDLANIFASTSLNEAKIGLDIDQLASIYEHIEFGSFDECRDWCMFIFAFFGLLRVSEYTGGSLHQSDVVATRAGVSLWLPFHKTSSTPVRIEISRRSDCLCPVRAYRRYCAFLGAVCSEASLPFFVSSLSSRNPCRTVQSSPVSDPSSRRLA